MLEGCNQAVCVCASLTFLIIINLAQWWKDILVWWYWLPTVLWLYCVSLLNLVYYCNYSLQCREMLVWRGSIIDWCVCILMMMMVTLAPHEVCHLVGSMCMESCKLSAIVSSEACVVMWYSQLSALPSIRGIMQEKWWWWQWGAINVLFIVSLIDEERWLMCCDLLFILILLYVSIPERKRADDDILVNSMRRDDIQRKIINNIVWEGQWPANVSSY